MTYLEALAIYGLSPGHVDPDEVNLIRKHEWRLAGPNNYTRQLELNLARDILLGLSEPESNFARSASANAANFGHVLARCNSESETYFALYWEHFLGAERDEDTGEVIDLLYFCRGDLVKFEPTERVFYIGSSDEKISPFSPLNNENGNWQSQFKAVTRYEQNLCPCCTAPNLRFCEKCNIPFCFHNSLYYEKLQLECPTCKVAYYFTNSSPSKEDQKIEDGRIVRALDTPNMGKLLR